MFKTLEETNALIREGKLLHISGPEHLLRKLDKGKWIGGTIEYLVPESGGMESGQLLDVDELGFSAYKLAVYSESTLPRITDDAYENGFTVLISPFENPVYMDCAEHVTGNGDLFTKCNDVNLINPDAVSYAVNGYTGEFFTDKAVAIHVKIE